MARFSAVSLAYDRRARLKCDDVCPYLNNRSARPTLSRVHRDIRAVRPSQGFNDTNRLRIDAPYGTGVSERTHAVVMCVAATTNGLSYTTLDC